jgi:hypothetical protein
MFEKLLALTLIALCANGCSQAVRYEQLFAGYNGPRVPKTEYFGSASSVKASWIAKALSPAELERVLSRVPFERDMLVAASVGMRESVTQVSLDSISAHGSVLSTNVRIGVIEVGCLRPHSMSYPFVLAVVRRPNNFDGSGGLDHQNFPDGCAVVMSGAPNE